MCSGNPGGIIGTLQRVVGKGGQGKAALSSGGYDGGAPLGTTKGMLLKQRRKAAKLPSMPLLGLSGEQVDPNAARA